MSIQHALKYVRRRPLRVALSLIFLVIGYPASFGPACWILAHVDLMKQPAPQFVFTAVYEPVAVWMVQQRGETRSVLNAWISLGLPSGVKLLPRDDAIVWVTPTYSYTVISMPLEPESH